VSTDLTEQDRAKLRDAIQRASHHSVSWERKQFERKTLIRKQVVFFSLSFLFPFPFLTLSTCLLFMFSLSYYPPCSRRFPFILHLTRLSLSLASLRCVVM